MTFEEVDGLAQRRSGLDPKTWAAEDERLRNYWRRQEYEAMMDERQLESQSRLLIELGEPEAWLETMLRAARRSAAHADDIGDRAMSGRWRNLARSLEHAAAATAQDPMQAGQDQSPSDLEPSDTATQSQAEPQHQPPSATSVQAGA